MRELYSKQDRDRLDAAKAEWWKNYAEGAVEVDEVIVKYLADSVACKASKLCDTRVLKPGLTVYILGKICIGRERSISHVY